MGVKKEIDTKVDPAVFTAALLDEINGHLIDLIDKIEEQSKKNTRPSKLYITPETAITVATPIEPDSPDTISDPNAVPPITGYQQENVFNALQRISPKISVINDGTDILYVISTADNKTWSQESTILPGESRDFYIVYELRLRSPTVGDSVAFTGGVYRVTEQEFKLAYSGLQPSTASITGSPTISLGNSTLTTIMVEIFGTPMNATIDTLIPLGAGATFFGVTRDFKTSRLGFMGAFAFSDVVSAANGFRIQQSNEGLIWVDEDAIITTAVFGGFSGRVKSAVATRFARVAYTNGGAPQLIFSLGSRAMIS